MKLSTLYLLLLWLICFNTIAQEDKKSSLFSNGMVYLKYSPLFGTLGTEYNKSQLIPPNFTEICLMKGFGPMFNVSVSALAGKLTSGDDYGIKHEMNYVGVKLGISLKGSLRNENNKSFFHMAYCIVPTSQTITVNFWDYNRWSKYSEGYEADKTYHYVELGYTFLINLNRAKTLHALFDISMQITPDTRTPFTQHEALENYNIIVPGAGSLPLLNPSMGVGICYSF